MELDWADWQVLRIHLLSLSRTHCHTHIFNLDTWVLGIELSSSYLGSALGSMQVLYQLSHHSSQNVLYYFNI